MPDGTKKSEADQPVPLTNMQVRVYCENSGIVCPCCLSNDLRITGSPEHSGSRIYQNCRCEACGAEFTDEYKLVGVVLNSVNGKEVRG